MDKLIIPARLYSSKNSRQIVEGYPKCPVHQKRHQCQFSGQVQKQKFTVKSGKAQQNYKTLRTLLKDAKRKRQWERMLADWEWPIYLYIRIYRQSHRVFDYTNICQNLFDALVAEGYLPNDNMKYLIPRPMPYRIDKDRPRIVLWIEERESH